MSTTTSPGAFVERELTLEEWAALDEDEEGELVDGRLVAEEEVGTVHDLVASWLAGCLWSWAKEHGAAVFGSDTRFAIAPRRGRKPDAYVYLGGRRPKATNLVRSPPDAMIEVVSPTPRDARRDRFEKLIEYAQFGVRWYWIVDPALRTFEVLELTDSGRYLHAVSASTGRVADLPGFPGLAIDLDELWAEVDRCPPEDA